MVFGECDLDVVLGFVVVMGVEESVYFGGGVVFVKWIEGLFFLFVYCVWSLK